VSTDDDSLSCQECGATIRFHGTRTTKCPYCASPSVLARPPGADLPNPDFVVAFVIGQASALERAKKWTQSRGVFTHGGIRHASIEDVRGVYLPAYLYTSIGNAAYSAQIGENYQETETYTVTVNGKTETRTRTVTKTEWRSLSGRWQGYFRDVVVSGSRGLPNAELEAVEPFDLRALRRYSEAQVQGWVTEEPSLQLAACMAEARKEAMRDLGEILDRLMPGDSHSDLQFTSQFEREQASFVLVPCWVLAVRYDQEKPPVRLVINGQTGKAWGKAPLSWSRIVIAIVLGLALIAGIVLVAGRQR
jgi:hypothetical protein